MPNFEDRTGPRDRTRDAVVAVDAWQTIVAWNRQAESLLGRSEEDVIGRKCYEVMRGRLPSGKCVCRAGCAVKRRARGTTGVKDLTLLVEHARGEHVLLMVSTLTVRTFGDGCTVHLMREARSRELAETSMSRLTGTSLADITRREADVLGALARGMSTPEIARHLFVSPLTVRTHVRNLLRKKNLRSRVQLALFAQKNGLA